LDNSIVIILLMANLPAVITTLPCSNFYTFKSEIQTISINAKNIEEFIKFLRKGQLIKQDLFDARGKIVFSLSEIKDTICFDAGANFIYSNGMTMRDTVLFNKIVALISK
jgi:hypothetical protein